MGNSPVYFGIKKVAGTSYTGFDVRMVAGSAGQLLIDCSTETEDRYSLMIYTVSGNKIKSEELQLMKGTTRKEFNLKPGMYICELRNSRGDAVQQKTVVH